MRIRLALSLSIVRHRAGPDQPADEPPERETQVDALVDHAPDQPDAPRIGFRTFEGEQ